MRRTSRWEVATKLRVVVAGMLTGVLSLILAAPVLAGGWAVVTLDSLPRELEVDHSAQIGFMVRQHGVTPMAGLSPRIDLWQSPSAEHVLITAVPSGAVGHYEAALALPSPGSWEWSIEAFGAPQRMPDLAVGEPSRTAAGPALAWRLLGIVAFGLIAGAALALAFKRRRWAAGMLAALVLTGAAGIVAWRAASAAPGRGAGSTLLTEGRALFVAKGCVVCHDHQVFHDLRGEMGLEGFSVGPDLSGRSFSGGYLAAWLENPQAVIPSTMMPDLGLSPDEIAALTVFINAGPGY